jgi:hypothetical protein
MENIIPWDGYVKDKVGNDITTDDIVFIDRGKHKGKLATISSFRYTFIKDAPGLLVTVKLYREECPYRYPTTIQSDGTILYKKGMYNKR